eukprot:FR741769.1.p2 GENE.FR741769.1~~FR741769.1.p2  ORF type:complete len:115 (-),score=43.10 FR741769.1:690-1034(-)
MVFRVCIVVGGFGEGEKQFSPRKPAWAQDSPQARKLTLLKGKQKRELPPGGRPFKNLVNPLGFDLLAVIHCARFFFFFFFFFFSIAGFKKVIRGEARRRFTATRCPCSLSGDNP